MELTLLGANIFKVQSLRRGLIVELCDFLPLALLLWLMVKSPFCEIQGMTTMDVVRHYGGQPANFCEIGGEAYTKGKAALEMVLAKPDVKSLVVNFCGAFARCDVMMDGLLEAWDEVQPNIPVFFSIAGTGDEEAIAMLKDKLGMDPLPNMDAACKAAADAANEGGI